MAKLFTIDDLMGFEKDEFSLVGERIVVMRPVIDRNHRLVRQVIDVEKTREKARKWVLSNTDTIGDKEVEKYVETIMGWIKSYYNVR